MARLHFGDIGDWTPATISIIDKPYHSLATFEVFENDDDFIKKYIEPKEVNNMTQESNNNNVVVSDSFFERLLDKIVFKNEPITPEPSNKDDSNKEILDKLNEIEENQKATNKRLDALENPEPSEPTPAAGEGNTDEGNENNENNEITEGDEGENKPETVELPLNSDGTLDMENSVVAKYLPTPTGGSSQGIDPDLTRTSKATKSFNERSGRDSNGMSW